MKGILKYVRWLWSHSVGARASILVNILLGTLTVGLNLLFIFLCFRCRFRSFLRFRIFRRYVGFLCCSSGFRRCIICNPGCSAPGASCENKGCC